MKDEILSETRQKMDKAFEALNQEFKKTKLKKLSKDILHSKLNLHF